MSFDATEILDFWFGENGLSPEGYKARMEKWFTVNEDFDEEVRSRFESVLVNSPELTHSELHSDARQNLARIISTDQFPRNVFRGTPRAFAWDSIALGLTKAMIDSGMDKELNFVERLFAYVPLQHSEHIEVQQLSVKMFELLADSAEHPVFQDGGKDSIVYAVLHKDIIERFGRFPHRNEILGRESTPEEIEYLESGGENFGQVKK